MKNRIKQLRNELHLNQTEFGAKIGVKQGTIAGYENGSRKPMDAVISAICKEWNVSEEWLRNGTGEMFVDTGRQRKIHEWAEKVLADSPESFRYRFVNALTRLPDEWWELAENAAFEILADYDPEKAKEILSKTTAANQNVTDTAVGNITDADQETSHTTYEVGTNFGAVGDGATIINHDS